MSLILNLYRRTYWLAQASADKSNASNVNINIFIIKIFHFQLKNSHQLREGMSGTRRIRGQTLGIVGFGRVNFIFFLEYFTYFLWVMIFAAKNFFLDYLKFHLI